ncbi:C_GCAxxG_C_C family protein, partial [Dysosmobacter welbionis]
VRNWAFAGFWRGYARWDFPESRRIDDGIPALHHHPLHGVAKLSDIARPGPLFQSPNQSGHQMFCKAILFVEKLDKVPGQWGDIRHSFPQRRHVDGQYVQSVIQVCPECLFLYHLPQIPIGGGNDPYVAFLDPVAAQTLDFAGLDDPQQFGLEF